MKKFKRLEKEIQKRERRIRRFDKPILRWFFQYDLRIRGLEVMQLRLEQISTGLEGIADLKEKMQSYNKMGRPHTTGSAEHPSGKLKETRHEI